jgi:hypothetical protein
MNAPPTRVAEQQAEAIKRAGDIAAFLTAETLDALRELAADDSAWNDAAEDPAAALADRGITIPDDVDLVLYEHAWTGSPDSPDPAEDRTPYLSAPWSRMWSLQTYRCASPAGGPSNRLSESNAAHEPRKSPSASAGDSRRANAPLPKPWSFASHGAGATNPTGSASRTSPPERHRAQMPKEAGSCVRYASGDVEQLLAVGERDGLDLAVDAELPKDVGDVRPDRLAGDEEALGDLVLA